MDVVPEERRRVTDAPGGGSIGARPVHPRSRSNLTAIYRVRVLPWLNAGLAGKNIPGAKLPPLRAHKINAGCKVPESDAGGGEHLRHPLT